MIVPDVNLLLYAHIDAFPQHEHAVAWWRGVLNTGTPVGICDPVVFGFLRIATNPRVLETPLTIGSATDIVEGWFSRPTVSRLVGGPGHLRAVLELLAGVGTAGNLTTDAQIAALAIEHHAAVYSNDSDFVRFPAVKSVNPLS
ncbi:TA system VapC family ribonuclease toxin [Tsukamurella soli]|uniref:Ribonuclease VapC n=1 Tax=Tsukamurella soli TaxID=644556 RepID=A0ABP8JWL3_9ACTN